MNKEIELLNKKIEAQDKIINEQVLEIAHVHLQLDQALKIAKELLIKIDKAIEYIKENKYENTFRLVGNEETGEMESLNGELLDLLENNQKLVSANINFLKELGIEKYLNLYLNV